MADGSDRFGMTKGFAATVLWVNVTHPGEGAELGKKAEIFNQATNGEIIRCALATHAEGRGHDVDLIFADRPQAL